MFSDSAKKTKRRVHLRAFGPDGSYYMEIAILKMNLIRSVVGAQLYYFRKKVIAVISAPVLYLGQCAYRGAIAQLQLVETVSKEKVFFRASLKQGCSKYDI